MKPLYAISTICIMIIQDGIKWIIALGIGAMMLIFLTNI